MTAGKLQLKIVVVGAGLGGLAAAIALCLAGHSITVYERTKTLSEVGAGIQVPPNATVLLKRWGVPLENLQPCRPAKYEIMRWKDNSLLCSFDLNADKYPTPYLQAHRADYQNALLQRALELGIPVIMDSAVTEWDFDEPSITLTSGEVVRADLIVAADGIKSRARLSHFGGDDKPRETGEAAWRFNIPSERILADPDLRDLVLQPKTTNWSGPDCHIIGYPIRQQKLYNVVICVTDNGKSAESWLDYGNPDEIREQLKDWNPVVTKLLAMCDSVLKGKLMDHSPLKTWVVGNRTVLLGDSAHPMLPYVAQGAAQAIEDAGVLGSLMSDLVSSDIGELLKAYEELRLPRATNMQVTGAKHAHIWHLHDGPEQEQRDRNSRTLGPKNPTFWADEARKDRLFLYDGHEVAQEWLKLRQ